MISGIFFATVAFGASLIWAADQPSSCKARQLTSLLGADNGSTCPRMSDLDSRPENHPWTHIVKCMESPDDDYGKPQTFCLYTRAASGPRRGCSIVTTPRLAKAFSLGDTSKGYNKGIKESTTTLNSTLPVYETRETKGRGIGTFATSSIEAGQVVFTDSPVFIALRDALDLLPRAGRQEMQWRGVLQLPADVQKLFRNLSKSRGGDEIDDILQTNALGLNLEARNGYLALMPQVAVRWLVLSVIS
jgi:hypothetical protein